MKYLLTTLLLLFVGCSVKFCTCNENGADDLIELDGNKDLVDLSLTPQEY